MQSKVFKIVRELPLEMQGLQFYMIIFRKLNAFYKMLIVCNKQNEI